MKKHWLNALLVASALAYTGLAAAAAPHAHAGMTMGAGSMHESNAAAPATSVVATDCWIRSLPPPTPSGAYLVVKNDGRQAAKLVGASSPAFGMVMLHRTIEKDGMSSMTMEPEITIPAGKSVSFAPGGYHVMLEDPKSTLVVGSTLTLRLQLASGQTVDAQCLVKPPSALSR